MMGLSVKIIGACLILTGATLFGIRYRNFLHRRCVLLDSIYKTLKMIREKIVHENELLEDSMLTCGNLYPVEEGNLFAAFASSMDAVQAPKEAWKCHVNTYLKKYGLDTETLVSGLCDFGEAWQHVSTESVSDSISHTCTVLEQEIQTAETKKEKEGALVLKLSLAMGVLLIVLLI
ncbi:MAG: stage III sporulation protein AB [Clostridia bacterium]|nr:stage III sporulation protein AB [Clostridia bacterium]